MFTELPHDLLECSQALANPASSDEEIVPTKRTIRVNEHSYSTAHYSDFVTDGSTRFLIDEVPEMFDSGWIVEVQYSRNKDKADCLENEVLDTGGSLNEEEIQPFLSRLRRDPSQKTIRVVLKTDVNGNLVLLDPEEIPEIKHPLPNDLPLPHVSISSIRRERSTTYPSVDIVTIPGSLEYHILKHTPRLQSPEDICNGLTAFGKELQFMATGLPDPSIVVAPTAVVTDGFGSLRGYLMPYHPAGSVRNVFRQRHKGIFRLAVRATEGTREPRRRIPRYLHDEHEPTPFVRIMPHLPWRLKLAWTIDITSALAALHGQGIFWGDLKLDNILLCKDGRCRFIDYYPHAAYSEEYAPPELGGIWALDFEEREKAFALVSSPSSSRDVFSLGLVLWAVAEEVSNFEREEAFEIPSLVWSDDVPLWYLDLAESCLSKTTGHHPPAKKVLDVLLQHY